MSNSTITFSLFEFIASIGFASIFAVLIYIGRKLQILDDLSRTVEKTKHNIKVIADNLIKDEPFDPVDLQSYSPLQLTDEGRGRLEKIGFLDIFAKNKKEFFDFIEAEEVKTKYDVEIAAIKSVSFLFDRDFFNPLKEYFYNNPEIDERKIRSTIGIYIRDQYLSERDDI